MNIFNAPLSPPPLPRREHFIFEPLEGDPKPLLLLETLLKHPGRVIHTLHSANLAVPAIWFLLFALGGMALYGGVVGSLTGGAQLWIAPAKLVLGTLLSILICLPSLYIFTCLGGNDVRLGAVAGGFAAAVCLSSLLLIGFAPVAWIFSQSTDSVAFTGSLHLLFWLIGLFFGLRLIGGMSRFRGEKTRGHLKTWSVIFILVCLQMTTTLRPIMTRSDCFWPGEKKIFVTHWVESLGGKR